MNQIFRFFLTVEGENDAYPNYHSAKIHVSEVDPAEIEYQNLFISSPLFSPHKEGSTDLPELNDGTKITFLMVPEIYPAINDILREFSIENELWFSIGLANVIVFDQKNNSVGAKIVSYLEHKNNLTSREVWTITNSKLDNTYPADVKHYSSSKNIHHCKLKISQKLPSYLKFAVSEYIISVDKFLTASKKFTPHYFQNHKSTISAASDLIADLSFLHGDDKFEPSSAIMNNLKVTCKEEALKSLSDPLKRVIVQDLINDRHGMIIQFNSSLSYIYSQAYSGTFPIFDHIGIVRRHSLLGLGTAIGSLYELIRQLEKAFYYLPFEDLTATNYATATVPADYFSIIGDPSFFNTSLWKDDLVKRQIVGAEIKDGTQLSPDFFHRLSFFSGRLGFREYEFSATAAIQVLVESYKLPWHIINYTHEIIHNHVRLLLNQLVIPPDGFRNESYLAYLNRCIDIINNVFDQQKKSEEQQISYFDYFGSLLVKFVMNAEIYGSLSSSSDSERITQCQADPNVKIDYYETSPEDLREQIRIYYKDMTEIFVHVIDYCYIYKQRPEIYLMSIWTSWATIPAVANDLSQYVLRTLVILGISIDGKVMHRCSKAVAEFKQLLIRWQAERPNAIFGKILSLFEDETFVEDLRFRFYNCIIVGDLVFNYFVAKLETLLDNNDSNNLPKDEVDDEGNPILYYISTNSFEGQEILSKVRFLLDQLCREIYSNKVDEGDGLTEKTSAWLLLSLSSCRKL